MIADPVANFVGAQLGRSKEDLLTYAQHRQTRYQHCSSLQQIYGKHAYDPDDTELVSWIASAAELARSDEALANTIVARMRQKHILVPGPTTVERLCADALRSLKRKAAFSSSRYKLANNAVDGNFEKSDLTRKISNLTTTRCLYTRHPARN